MPGGGYYLMYRVKCTECQLCPCHQVAKEYGLNAWRKVQSVSYVCVMREDNEYGLNAWRRVLSNVQSQMYRVSAMSVS